MRLTLPSLVLALACMVMIISCSPKEPKPDLTTKKLHEFYPGDSQKVDYIEIRSGSTGQLKSYTDPLQIQDWIQEIGQLQMVPDPNQEDRSGFLYGVSLYENKVKKLSFTNNSIAGHYYLHNEQLVNKLEAFFESQPK